MNIFSQKNKKRLNVVMGIVGIIVIIGMVLLYSPIFTQPQTIPVQQQLPQ